MSSTQTILTLLLILSLPVAAQAETPPPAPPQIAVGAILPLTGSSAAFGLASKRGIELALKDLPPQDRARVKVIVEDDGLVSSQSITAAQKLINVEKVDALLTWSSGTALAVKGLSESKGIPQIAVASDPTVARGTSYSFNNWPIPETETRSLYEYLQAHGKRRIGMVTQINSFPLAMRDALVAHVKRDGEMELVADEEISSDATDLRSSLLRLKNKGSLDTFIVAFFPGQLALVVKQAREIGITAPLFGYETFEDKASFDAAGGLFTNVIYSTGADARQDFLEEFTAKYPGESYYTANQSYDIIRILVDASRQRKDGASIAHFLQTLKDYPTVSGVISATGDNRFTLPTTLKTLDAHGVPHPVSN
jgi:branched-chain amino acid transport system substrate-binding protein